MLYKEFKFNLSNFFVSMHAQFKYFHIFRFSTGNNTGAIVGGTIAGLVVVAIILFIIYHSDRKKKGLPIVPPKVTYCWNQTKQFINQPRLPRFIRQQCSRVKFTASKTSSTVEFTTKPIHTAI